MARADIMAGRAYVSLYMRDRLTRDLQAARQRVNKFGSDMMALGAKMVAMSAAIATPLGLATKTFAEFDDAMRAVKAVTRATGDEFASMTDRAKELGRTTSFTAVQVAQLMTELGRAGFRPDEINRMTDAVMNLSRATGTDAALSAGIVAASLRQFALDATQAARVADVLTTAANSTFNTVEGLGESLKYAGPVAKDLGLSLEETVAILGSLGNVGIQGSDAGTALRRLGVISAANGKKLKALFGVINTDHTGKLKPLVQIMDEIGQATAKMAATEKVEKMKEAFGLLGITAASVVSTTAVSTADLTKQLQNAEGAAESAAKEMDKGLGGAFRIIMSAVEGLSIAIGEALSDTIQGVTESITALLGAATEWVGKNREVAVTVAAVTVAVGAAGASLIALGVAAKVTGVGLGVVASGIVAAKTAAAVAVGVIGALETAIYAAGVIATTSGTAMALAGAGVSAAWTAASTAIVSAMAAITAPATAAAAAIAAIGIAAAVVTAKTIDMSGAWEVAKKTLSEIIDVAKRVGGVLMQSLAGGDYDIAFAAGLAGIKLALAAAIDAMIELWGMFWRGVWRLTKAFFANVLRLTWKSVNAIADALANPAKAAVSFQQTMKRIMSEGFTASIGLDTDKMRAEAKAELDRLEAELAERKKKREAEAAVTAAKDGTDPGKSAPSQPGNAEREIERQIEDLKAKELKAQQDKAAEEQRKAASARIIDRIRDFADTDYDAHGTSSDEVRYLEQRAIAYQRQIGAIDEATAKEAMMQADIRHEERLHQEQLKKFRGEKDKDDKKKKKVDEGPGISVKAHGSAATFSARSLLSMGSKAVGEAKQVKATQAVQKTLEKFMAGQAMLTKLHIKATKDAVPKHA